MAAVKRFVKSADTSTSVGHSQRDLERILRRYGASDFQQGSDWENRIARIAFRVPDTPGSKVTVPVRLEVSITAVATALGWKFPSQYGWEQAERVAWRHLVLWVDAACSASSAGLQTMSEAFLAHTLVRDPTSGEVKKISAMMDAAAGDGGYRALLPAAT